MPIKRGPNVRSERTRRAIREAFLSLAEERLVANIDVSAIVERANLSRATFYLHYADKQTLVDEVLTDLVAQLNGADQQFRALPTERMLARDVFLTDTLYAGIAERPNLFQMLLSQFEPGGFADRLRQYHEASLVELWERFGYAEEDQGMPMEVWARFVAVGTQGIILQWLETGQTPPPADLPAWIWNLAYPDHEQNTGQRPKLRDVP